MPSVSVVLPVFNRASPLGAALKSVFAQTYQDFEIILVDDGSAEEVVSSLPSGLAGRLRRLHQSHPMSAQARSAGTATASGHLIAFLDADTEWMPEKLGAQVDYFERHPATGMLCTGVVGSTANRGAAPASPLHAFADVFHARFTVNTQTVMVPKLVVEDVGGFREFGDGHAEDWDLWLRVAARHPIGYLAELLTFLPHDAAERARKHLLCLAARHRRKP